MRVAMLSTNMARGGAETQIARLAIELRRRGHAVSITSLRRPSAYVEDLGNAGVLLSNAAVIRQRPQILHCHMFHANILGRLLRTVFPFPVVISTIHSTAETKAVGGGQLQARDLAYQVTDCLADAVVGVSRPVVERHQAAKAVRKALVIPNGVDTDRFRPPTGQEREQARRGLDLRDSQFVWIAVGRLMWKKNFGALLRALPNDSRTVLLLVGAGPDEPELRRVAGPNVRFLGERTDIPQLLWSADGYVISSTVEGLPLAFLEAAACGLPCLATDVGGIRETQIGFVLQNSAELGPGLERMASLSQSERQQFGMSARAIIEASYSLSAVTTEWESLYRELLTAST